MTAFLFSSNILRSFLSCRNWHINSKLSVYPTPRMPHNITTPAYPSVPGAAVVLDTFRGRVPRDNGPDHVHRVVWRRRTEDRLGMPDASRPVGRASYPHHLEKPPDHGVDLLGHLQHCPVPGADRLTVEQLRAQL